MIKLLALDQATRTSGYAIFYDDELKDYGKFTFTDDNLGKRLVKIRNKVISLIQQYEINEVAFEDIQLQSSVENNVVTYKMLAEVFGVIEELCSELKINYRIIHSSTWKSFCGIRKSNRPAEKKEAQNFVLNTYQIKCSQDESDAICLGRCALKNAVNDGYNWE